MERVTEAFVWPTRDPEWVSKTLITAVILIIPILGAINATGWMVGSLRNLRRGEERLAPAGFDNLGIGAKVFLVLLGYSLAVGLAGAVAFIPGLALSTAAGNNSSQAVLLIPALLLYVLGYGVWTLGSLALNFVTPAIVLATDEGGIGAGFNVGRVLKRIRLSPTNTLIAGLMLLVAGIIGSLGAVACCIGVFATVAYSFAIQAWVIRSYEFGSRPEPIQSV
jgi:hypothetical protein